MADLSYSELEAELRSLPVTLIPALLRVLIQEAVAKNVFVEGGLEKFVSNTLRQEEPPRG